MEMWLPLDAFDQWALLTHVPVSRVWLVLSCVLRVFLRYSGFPPSLRANLLYAFRTKPREPL
jgi:hypothetical protein